jgi:protein involved in polysaccharide export with SLBB domain
MAKFHLWSLPLLIGLWAVPGISFGQEGIPGFSPTPEQIQKAKDLLKQPAPSETSKETPAVSEKATPPEEIPSGPSEQKPSAFEAYVQSKSSQGISTQIQQFGYDLFQRPPSTFAPAEAVPVGPDYLLGPGDELRIILWGKVNAEYSIAIDREGKINLPQIGVVPLSGLSFSEAKEFLEKEFGRYYKPSEVKMNVSMGKLRSIRVFVVGKAQRPGSYTLSSFSTLINALFAAGGPSKIGTMRDIQVKRGGESIIHFDLYDFLLKGDKTKDIRLMPEDVIFIPPAGPLVGVAGNVKSPAIYELKGPIGPQELIEMSGGLNEIAFKNRVQIHRIVENSRVIVFESNLEEVRTGEIRIQSGDLIMIFPVVQDRRMVRLSGAVQMEGEFGVTPGMTVKDLISVAGGLKYYAYSQEAELTRVTPTLEGPKTEKIMIHLEKALAGDPAANIPIKEDDYLFIRAVPEWDLYQTVAIRGEVKFPGTYTIKKGETLSSLIERAGGYTDRAYLKGATFTRESVRKLQQVQLDEAIDRLEQQLLSQTASTIEAALTPEAAVQLKAAMEQRRTLIAKMRAAKAKGRISIELNDLEKLKGSVSDLTLEEGDILFIPERPQQIQVIGAVYNQTAFMYTPEWSVSTYLKKAGGMTRDAEESELFILKVDGTAISKSESPGFMSLRWDSENHRWVGGGFMSSSLDPGDTVVVPEKVEHIVWLREIKDITQILFQIALATGVVVALF